MYFCGHKSFLPRTELCGGFCSQLAKIISNLHMKRENKTKIFKVRLTESEYSNLKERAKKYNGRVSHLFKFAIDQLNDVQARNRFEVVNEYIKYWRSHEMELRHIGTNFNQAIKRVNEMALHGNFDKQEAEELLNQLMSVREMIESYIGDLDKFSRRVLKK